MDSIKKIVAMGVVVFVSGMLQSSWVVAGDLDDDIANVSDDPIAADDNLGAKANNINFIVASSVGKAKNKADKDNGAEKKSKSSSSISNFNDGTGDTNENSVVVEAGSHVDKVYNIIIDI